MNTEITTIEQLVLSERAGRSRGDWDRLRATFHTDSLVETSWFTGTGAEFVEMSIRRAAAGTSDNVVNRLAPALVEIAGERALVQLPSLTTRWFVLDEVEMRLDSWMRLVYRVTRQSDDGGDPRWGIIRLNAINEADSLTPSIPGTAPRIDPGELAGFRRSYRFLSLFHQMHQGSPPSSDLLGVDRPDQVAEFYAEGYAWLDRSDD